MSLPDICTYILDNNLIDKAFHTLGSNKKSKSFYETFPSNYFTREDISQLMRNNCNTASISEISKKVTKSTLANPDRINSFTMASLIFAGLSKLKKVELIPEKWKTWDESLNLQDFIEKTNLSTLNCSQHLPSRRIQNGLRQIGQDPGFIKTNLFIISEQEGIFKKISTEIENIQKKLASLNSKRTSLQYTEDPFTTAQELKLKIKLQTLIAMGNSQSNADCPEISNTLYTAIEKIYEEVKVLTADATTN